MDPYTRPEFYAPPRPVVCNRARPARSPQENSVNCAFPGALARGELIIPISTNALGDDLPQTLHLSKFKTHPMLDVRQRSRLFTEEGGKNAPRLLPAPCAPCRGFGKKSPKKQETRWPLRGREKQKKRLSRRVRATRRAATHFYALLSVAWHPT